MNEIEDVLDEGVMYGHIEKSKNGKYRITESGIAEAKRMLVLQVLAGPDKDHLYALSYGAILCATQLKEDELNPLLADLIASGKVQMGKVKHPSKTTIFTLPGLKHCHLLGGPEESPGDHKKAIGNLMTLLRKNN